MTALVKFMASGNFFRNFKTIGTTMVSFDYCDRRRNGQVARRYLITFEKDGYGVIDIMAVSAGEGRVEHFKNCRMIETAKGLIRKARIEAFEAEFGAEIEALQAEKAKKEAEKKAEKTAEILYDIAFYGFFTFAVILIGILQWNEGIEGFVILWAIPLAIFVIFSGAYHSWDVYHGIKEKLNK